MSILYLSCCHVVASIVLGHVVVLSVERDRAGALLLLVRCGQGPQPRCHVLIIDISLSL